MRGSLPLLLVAGLAGPAVADPKAEAKAHADAATKLYAVQQYEKAADEWQQAYLLDADRNYLYASAQAQRLGGDCVKALHSYNAYLRTMPADESPARANIERCEQYLRDHPRPVEPLVAPSVPVPAVPPAPVAPPPELVTRSWTSDRLGHVLVVGGLAVAATGTVLYLRGRSAIDDNNSAATYAEFDDAHRAAASARTKLTIGVSAMAVGGGLVLGGVLHYILHTRPVAEARVVADIAPGAASIALTGSF